MEVGSIYGSYYEAVKSYQGIKEEKQKGSGTDISFAGKINEKVLVSPKDMTLEEYKKYFKEKMNGLYTHPSQRNMNEVIDITDAAYERMRTDPAYEQKVLNAIATNKAVNFGRYIPVYAYTHIDDTWEKSYGYTQGMKENDNDRSSKKSSKGLGDWWQERHERYEEWLEEQVKAAQKRKLLASSAAAAAYEDTISTFSKRVMEHGRL